MTTAVPAVVSATWLKDQLDAGRPDIRVLDVTWYSAKDALPEYLEKHIPGAGHFDIMHKAVHTFLFPRHLPPADDFAAYVRTFGVDDVTHVVVYDRNLNNMNGFFTGGRAWWMFKLHGHDKVSVLNGGLARWEAEGYPTTTEVPVFKEGRFQAVYNGAWRRSYEAMASNLSSPGLQVCDSRGQEAYRGKPEDPKTGHYPGAINVSIVNDLMDPTTKTIKSAEDLKQVFESHDLHLDKPTATMCNSGMSSCTLTLALTLAGFKDVGVFHGGFTEWSSKAEDGHIDQCQ